MTNGPNIPSTLWHGYGTPGLLTSKVYDRVEHEMLHGRPRLSFANQIAAMVDIRPTAFLLTANSAVPVADSIRGYYDELGIDRPVIDYIRVPGKGWLSGLLQTHIEEKRLQYCLNEAGAQVCVVDEYVFSGGTLERARNLLKNIGVTDVTEIRGRWYSQAKRAEIDLDRVTSVHAPKMREIGQKACLAAS